MANQEIKEAAKNAGVKLWEIAEAMGVCESTFHRHLRHECTEGKKRMILDIIGDIAKKKEGVI